QQQRRPLAAGDSDDGGAAGAGFAAGEAFHHERFRLPGLAPHASSNDRPDAKNGSSARLSAAACPTSMARTAREETMSLMEERRVAIEQALERVRRIEAEHGVTRAALEALKPVLIELAARRDLFPPEHFPLSRNGH